MEIPVETFVGGISILISVVSVVGSNHSPTLFQTHLLKKSLLKFSMRMQHSGPGRL